jgi:hypothetical protein
MGRATTPDPRLKSRQETSDVERAGDYRPGRKYREQRQYAENEGLARETGRAPADPVDTTESAQLEEAAQRGRAP